MIKKKRIDIKTIEDFKANVENIEDIETIKKSFNLSVDEYHNLNKSLNNTIAYRVSNINEFIDYIKSITKFEKLNLKLEKKLKEINILIIEREEYERNDNSEENLSELLEKINHMKKDIASNIQEENFKRLEKEEEILLSKYLYSKDIELLKQILVNNSSKIEESYDKENLKKILKIYIINKINIDYIKVKEGTVEYYFHLKNIIPRLERLIKNLNNYLKIVDENKKVVKIDQTYIMQDSINIAIAELNGKEYKGISGKVNLEGYCPKKNKEDCIFESKKVNKLGEFGKGYERFNDSEKKIFENIAFDIDNNEEEKIGILNLYTKYEPCFSCYYVIYQFKKRYPKIEVQIWYNQKYGQVKL